MGIRCAVWGRALLGPPQAGPKLKCASCQSRAWAPPPLPRLPCHLQRWQQQSQGCWRMFWYHLSRTSVWAGNVGRALRAHFIHILPYCCPPGTWEGRDIRAGRWGDGLPLPLVGYSHPRLWPERCQNPKGQEWRSQSLPRFLMGNPGPT